MPWSSFSECWALSQLFHSFAFIKRLFSSSLSAIRVVSSAYLRLLIFLPAILIPACASSSPAFLMMYSAHKLNKQGDNIQPWHTPFPIWKQSVFPCPVLTVASWPAYSSLLCCTAKTRYYFKSQPWCPWFVKEESEQPCFSGRLPALPEYWWNCICSRMTSRSLIRFTLHILSSRQSCSYKGSSFAVSYADWATNSPWGYLTEYSVLMSPLSSSVKWKRQEIDGFKFRLLQLASCLHFLGHKEVHTEGASGWTELRLYT